MSSKTQTNQTESEAVKRFVSSDNCILNLRQIGCLTVGEDIAISQMSEETGDHNYLKAIELAAQIDSEQGLKDLEFAFEIVTNGFNLDDKLQEVESQKKDGNITEKEAQQQISALTDKNKIIKKCQLQYASHFIKIRNQGEYLNKKGKINIANVFLQNRILDQDKLLSAEKKKKIIEICLECLSDVNIEIKNEASKKLTSELNLWTEADTQSLDKNVFDEIWQFIQTEMGGNDDTEASITEPDAKTEAESETVGAKATK